MIVEVVGIDGAGKSTLVRALAAHTGAEARKTDAFPGDTHALAAAVGARLGTQAEAAFRGLAIARALLTEATSITTDRAVYDRFVEGARMYFAVKRVQPLDEDLLAALPQPEVVLLIDVPISLGLARRARPAERGAAAERTYLQACGEYLRGRAARQGWVVIDGARPAKDVLVHAIKAVAP